MQYDYFVASRYRNKPEVLRLVHALQHRGKSVYSFIESDASVKHVGKIEDDTEKQMEKYESRNWKEDTGVKEIFQSDMEALRNSETLIMLLPAGKSVHIEAGAAYGMGKHTILIGEQKEAESLYLIFNEHYTSIDAFIQSL